MPKNSFRDPATNVLKAWGYVTSNTPGDLMQAEADNFALEPGKWQWTGAAWVPFTPPPNPPNPLKALIDASMASTDVPTVLKALFMAWKAQL